MRVNTVGTRVAYLTSGRGRPTYGPVVPQPRRTWVEQVMGLPVSVLARGGSAQSEAAQGAVAAVFAELVEVDRVFSPYRADSDVSRIGAGELTLAESAPEVRDVAAR